MTNVILSVLLLLVASAAQAGPYFRYLGGPGYQRQVLSEACFVPAGGIGATTSCTSVPIVTHSYKDGYKIIPNEDWAPITVGGAFGSTHPLLTIGPAANLTPTMKMLALKGLNAAAPNSFDNLKSLLAPPPQSNGPDVTMNIGTKWGVFPLEHAALRHSVWIFSIGPALLF